MYNIELTFINITKKS